LPPEIENHRAEKSFRLRLRKVKLITEAQLLAQASLGAHLSEHEAAVFAFLLRSGQVDVTDIKALTGLTGAQALDLAQRLTVQVLTEPMGEAAHTWRLVPHLRARFAAEATKNTTQDQSLGGEAVTEDATDQVTEQ